MTRRKFFVSSAAALVVFATARVARPRPMGIGALPGKVARIEIRPRYSVSTFAMTFTVSKAALSDTNYHSIVDAAKALGHRAGNIVISPGHWEVLTEPLVLG